MKSGLTLMVIVLLHVCTASPVQYEDRYDAAIAMLCGKNTKHRDVTTGEWVTDTTGNADCLSTPTEMLNYCRKVYPQLSVTNVVEETSKVKIDSWCSLGKSGPKCKGHSHAVVPVKCIVGRFQSPALRVDTGCQFLHVHNVSLCESHHYWAAVADKQCQQQSMVLQREFSPLKACVDMVDAWHGVEFVCCPSHKTKSNVDLINQPQDKPEPAPETNSICSLPKVIGKCRAAFDAWYFDTKLGHCQHFIYGGCGGNKNNFKNEVECAQACAPSTIAVDPVEQLPVFPGLGPVLVEDDDADVNPVCKQPKLVGLCKAMFHRWYYDTTTGQCLQFVYGGCGANGNNFKTVEDCQSTCLATTTTTTKASQPETSELSTTTTNSYFDSPLDMENEQQLYIQSVQKELEVHQFKLAKVMSDWDAANSQLLESAITDPKGVTGKQQKLDADMQRTKAALIQEHNQKQEQLSSVHEARMDALLVSNRQSALHNYLQQLNAEEPDAAQVFQSLQNYISNEKKDHEHTKQHIRTQPENSVKLQARLASIQDRIADTLTTLQQQHPEVYDQIDDDLSAFMDRMMPSFSFELDVETDQATIDNGGLEAEEDNEDDYYEDDEYDEYDEDEDEYDEEELDGDDDFDEDDVDDSEEDVSLPNVDVDINNDVDTEEYSDNEPEDDPEDADEDGDGDMMDVDEDEYYFNSAAIMGAGGDRTSEVAWLKWTGIAVVGGLVLIVCFASIVHYMAVRRRMTHRFTQIKVDDHLTSEERQLLQMQQNGYENPTYKFFEKQQMA